jgi:DNA-directed RNA polymerase, omega subunit
LDYEEEPMNPTTEVEDYSRYALDEDLDDEEEVDLDSEAENDDYLQEDGEEDDYSDGDYSSDSEE